MINKYALWEDKEKKKKEALKDKVQAILKFPDLCVSSMCW